MLSKFPDLFPRRVAVKVKPESCLETPLPGGCICEFGEVGEGGEPPLMVPLVPGLSYLLGSAFDCRNALKMGGLGATPPCPASPNDVELKLTSLASVDI